MQYPEALQPEEVYPDLILTIVLLLETQLNSEVPQ